MQACAQVQEADDRAESLNRKSLAAAHWSRLGIGWRLLLLVGAYSMSGSAIMFQFFTDKCFEEFEVKAQLLLTRFTHCHMRPVVGGIWLVVGNSGCH